MIYFKNVDVNKIQIEIIHTITLLNINTKDLG